MAANPPAYLTVRSRRCGLSRRPATASVTSPASDAATHAAGWLSVSIAQITPAPIARSRPPIPKSRVVVAVESSPTHLRAARCGTARRRRPVPARTTPTTHAPIKPAVMTLTVVLLVLTAGCWPGCCLGQTRRLLVPSDRVWVQRRWVPRVGSGDAHHSSPSHLCWRPRANIGGSAPNSEAWFQTHPK